MKKLSDMTTAEAIRWMVENNPGTIDPFNFGGAGYPACIFSNKPIEELKFPEGWYYNEKNGLNNKHTSSSGMYSVIRIEVME